MIRQGQVTLEVCVMIIVVAAALIVMYGYLRRSLQTNWKSNADSISDEQYDTANRTTETVSGITLTPNPKSLSNYNYKSHIAAFSLNNDQALTVTETSASGPSYLRIQNWQAPCTGDACGGEDD